MLPPEKMKRIMYDLLLVESYVETDTTLRTKASSMQDQVFRNHGLSAVEFQKSLFYYQEQHELYKQLADSLSAYATAQAADKLKVQIKLNLDGHHFKDSAGSIWNLKRNR